MVCGIGHKPPLQPHSPLPLRRTPLPLRKVPLTLRWRRKWKAQPTDGMHASPTCDTVKSSRGFEARGPSSHRCASGIRSLGHSLRAQGSCDPKPSEFLQLHRLLRNRAEAPGSYPQRFSRAFGFEIEKEHISVVIHFLDAVTTFCVI